MKRSTFTTFLLGTVLCSAWTAAAANDPDFEKTKPGELPQWVGPNWAKTGNPPYTAAIIADAKSAASGKQFLRFENKRNNSVWITAGTSMPVKKGYGIAVKVKIRGEGVHNMGFNVYDANRKSCRWQGSHSTAYSRISSKEWKEFTFRYLPLEGEAHVRFSIGLRNGKIDIDDLQLTYCKITNAERIRGLKTTPGLKVFSGFENWADGMPTDWMFRDGDTKSIVKRIALAPEEHARFGKYALYLNGQVIMDPPLVGLGPHRAGAMRLSFYAKGDLGTIRARLQEGRNGYVDYLIDLVEENTGSVWKKYAAAFSLPPACRIDNAAVELTGKNVIIDNVELKAAEGSDGKLIYSIPLVEKAPAIDGKHTPGEWDFAVGASDPLQLANFIESSSKKPVSPALSQQNTVRFCSDGKKLYFLFEVPEGAGFKRKYTERDSEVYCDDAVELHINPEFGSDVPRYSYQFVFNANNAVFDQRREKGGGDVKFYKWNAKTLVNRSTVANGMWILEGCVDLAEVGITPDKPFGLNVCSAKRNPDEAGSLNGASFLVLNFMVNATVSSKNPGVYWMKNGDWGSMLITFSNGKAPAGEYLFEYELDSENAAYKSTQKIQTAPGRTTPVLINVPGGAGKFGSIKMTLSDQNKKPVYRQTLDFNASISPVPEVEKLLEFHFLPEQEKYAVNMHKKGGWSDKVDRVELYGLTDSVIVFRKNDFKLFGSTFALKRPFPAGSDGKSFTISLLALDKNNTVLNTATSKVTVNRALIPRKSEKIYSGILPFYTPIKAKNNVAEVQLRKYTFAGNGLPQTIFANGEEALHAPICFTAEYADGKRMTGKNGKFRVTGSAEDELLFTGESVFPGFTVKLEGKLVYDGAVFYNARIIAEKPVALKRLSLEMPLNKLDYFQTFCEDRLRLWMCRQPAKGEYRHPSVKVWTPDSPMTYSDYRRFVLLFFPDGDGLLWNSCKVSSNGVIKNGFLPYLTAGNYKFGLEFFADTDRGWVHNNKSAIHEILRVKGKEIMRTNFIAMPWTLKGERHFEFGIMATPGKHKRRDLVNGYINGYSHTGLTDQALAGLRVKDWKFYSDQIDRFTRYYKPIQLCCKGHFPQMDPVAVYMDSEWRRWPKYFFRDAYASVSGRVFGVDQNYYFSPGGCYTPGRVDFYADRFEDFAKNAPGLQGFYWDENWTKPCNNPKHANCGYIMPDGQLQGRVWWTNVREVDRRAQHILRKHGRKDPLLQGFTGEGIIPHAHSFLTLNLMGEHFTYDMDFIDYWTPHFTEIAYAGAWGVDLGGFGMFRDPKYLARIHLNRAQLSLFKLYDALFLHDNFNLNVLKPVKAAEQRFRKQDKDVQFVGYFSDEAKKILPAMTATMKFSAFIRPGKGALIFVSNLGEKDDSIQLDFNLKDYRINQFEAFNAETLQKLDLRKKVTIKRHDFLMLELKSK